MERKKKKLVMDSFETIKDKKLPAESEKADSHVMESRDESIQSADIHKQVNEEKNKEKELRVLSRTELDVNWATIANKITIPNFAKWSTSLGSACTGSLLGVGLGTGFGFAIGGPAGAVVGSRFGNVAGFGAGIIGGYKLGKKVANALDEEDKKDIIKKGTTQVSVDTVTRIDTNTREE